MAWRRRVVAAVVATGSVGVLAPSSASAITITELATQPSSTQAGSHPNFTLRLRFGGGSTPKAMRIELPPGFVGNPNAVPKCSQAAFQAGGCAPESTVGTTLVHTNVFTDGGSGGGGGGGGGGGPLDPLDPVLDPVCGLLPPLCDLLGLQARTRATARRAAPRQGLALPLTATGTVYNLEPSAGEPARLGIQVDPVGGLLGSIRLQSTIEVRDGSDFGLTSVLDGLPNRFNGIPTQITGMDLTLLGTTANGGKFVTLPTRCTPATTNVSVTPHEGAAATGSASFQATGCESVPFTPALGVVPQTTQLDQPSAFSIRLGIPGEEDPVRQSHVSNVRVTLPEGVGLNPGTAVGLEVCTEAQFAQGSRNAPSCPAASQVGTVSFTSPLVGTLTGTVYEGVPTPTQMLRLFVDVPGPGLRIKLVGNVDPDPRTGQITSTFADLPQLPFTAFALNFRGGDKAILTTPGTCGAATSTAALTPYSGTGAAPAASQFMVTWDGQGTACPDPLPFNPSVSVDANPSTAGAATTLVQTISREPRTQRLKDMELSFPPGLLGGLGSGIGLCDLDKARAAACPKDSRVGSATLVAGPGGAPLNIAGDVFLTAPIDGSLAGLAISVPGKVGPFDLGTTVSLARIAVRPGDAGLEVSAKDLPQIVGGIPLNLRQIRLTLDRKGFMRNATSCAQQQLTARFASSLGATAQTTAPYRATDCDKVPYKPKLRGAIGRKGELARGASPSVTAVVSQGDGEISTRSVKVTLPKQVAAAITQLAGATCREGEDCGDRNVVGTATAVTPLLPLPLSGPVRLVAPAAGGLPELRIALSGLLSLSLTGKTALTPQGRVENTFEGIPDVPLSRFELKLKGGENGILVNTAKLRCGAKLRGTGEFTGHSGVKANVRGRFDVCGTVSAANRAKKRKKAKATARLRNGALRVTVTGRRRIRALRISLPKQARLAGRRGVSVSGGRKATTRVAKRSVRIGKLSAKRVTVTLGKRSLRGARKAKRVTVKVTMAKKARATLRVPVKR